MEKKCYICGHTIEKNQLYYEVGPHNYVCLEPWCYDVYTWDKIAAKYVVDTSHEYAIINNDVYVIGSDKDSPRGFSGRIFNILFNDGTYITTNSLWFKGHVPTRYRSTLRNNAVFAYKEEID